jgi:hypothetical protein
LHCSPFVKRVKDVKGFLTYRVRARAHWIDGC